MKALYQDASQAIGVRIKDLLGRMTLEEKIGQMIQIDGREDGETWIREKHIGSILHVTGDEAERLQRIAAETRLGIPLLCGIDAVHGHAFHDGATIFPSQLGMASSWNEMLLEKAAEVTAKEVILTGLHWTFSPVLCLARDIRWGRVDETFGEDPYLSGRLGAAMVRGYQGRSLAEPYSILACAKHFVAYGETQGGRDSAESDVTERKLRSIFFPPFKAAIDAGCATVMAAYHANDGVPCSANSWLLQDVLKGEWGFEGFVVTDWRNIQHMHQLQKVAASINEACAIAVEAGNDMMMNTKEFFDCGVQGVKEGKIDEQLVNEACIRILRIKFKLGLFDQKRFVDREQAKIFIGCDFHKKLAYQVALESIVLLKNDCGVLPLSRQIRKIAVIGPCADDPEQIGDWSFGSRNHPELPTISYHEYNLEPIITVVKGLHNRLGSEIEVVYEKGCDMIDPDAHSIPEAVNAARESDVVIAVVGDTVILNGETRDRMKLDLTGAQLELLKAVKAVGKPLVVVLINGKPLTIPWVKENADAILEAWNPGMEGGHAIADILFGEFNPCGKLAVSFPRHVGQQPVYYNQLPGWHGGSYVEMDDKPLFSFGFGLSYTKFSYSNLTLLKPKLNQGEDLSFSIDITNIGERRGAEILQVYVNDLFTSVTTPVKELKAFTRVELEPGERRQVKFEIPASELALVNRQCQRVVEPGEFELMVGGSSRDQDLLRIGFQVS
jgi:beta-glucosidase